jgi:hypothetical protein
MITCIKNGTKGAESTKEGKRRKDFGVVDIIHPQ